MNLRARPHATAGLISLCLLGTLSLASCGVVAVDPPDEPFAARAALSKAGTESATLPVSEPEEFTIVSAGDVLPHLSITNAAATGAGGYDFAPMFAPLQPYIEQADLALCSLEVPIIYSDQEP